MKELYLVRHAKSEWGDMALKDIDRPLKERGIRDALFMGEYISKKFTIPDRVLASPACRALHTSVLFLRAMKSSSEKILLEDKIYLASFDELQAVIKSTEDTVQCMMIVGHNPGITDLANFFLEEFIHNIPTAGFVYFQFDTDHWQQITTSNRVNYQLHYPKELMNAM